MSLREHAAGPMRSRFERSSTLATAASLVALLSAMPIAAQAADQPQAAQADVEEIVVTGSRIVRDGYEAPTPVTVIGVEQLQDSGKVSIFDTIAQFPTFAGNTTPQNSSGSVASGGAGAS